MTLACSGHVEAPSTSSAGQTNAGGAGKAAAGGGAGESSAGAKSSGGGGVSGMSPGSGGNDQAAEAGAAPLEAEAALMPTQGNGVSGTALFTQTDDSVALKITLKDCRYGAHAIHLHANAACADNANAAGGHWSPEGEGLGEAMCGADGVAQFTFTAPVGSWSIGAPAASDVLSHAIILHSGPSTAPADRIACGIPAKLP
jgi:Cu-Zn family superoxide dismutase